MPEDGLIWHAVCISSRSLLQVKRPKVDCENFRRKEACYGITDSCSTCDPRPSGHPAS